MRGWWRSAAAEQTPILMYHAVADEVGEHFARYAVRPRELDAQLAWLSDQGRTYLTVRRYAEGLRAGRVPADAVVLTFDDGFRDTWTEAVPILQRHGATATVFVTTAYLGDRSRWLAREGEGARPMLSPSDLREVAAAGLEVGGHSHTHPELDRLPAPALADEVRTCKAVLEDVLGAPVHSFAYPFGYHDGRVRRAVRDAGFDAACEVRHLASSLADDPLALRRRIVPRGLAWAAFRRTVSRPDGVGERAVRDAREATATLVRRIRRAPADGKVVPP